MRKAFPDLQTLKIFAASKVSDKQYTDYRQTVTDHYFFGGQSGPPICRRRLRLP